MSTRAASDRCPGVLRPWIADDGAIVRLRLVGGRLPTASLRALVDIAREHADGTILLTKRTNLQLRGIAHDDGCVSAELVAAITAAGLLPSPTHELVRNIMVSPLTGRCTNDGADSWGGRADLRGVADELDRLLVADPLLAGLAGRFLFVLDDGRGDVSGRPLDLGLVAVDETHGQLRVGTHHWGEIVSLADAPELLVDLARRFLAVHGEGASALWHVDELDDVSVIAGPPHARDLRTQVTSLPAPYGIIAQDDGRHAEHRPVPHGVLTQASAHEVLARAGEELIVTPWRSLLLPDLDTIPAESPAEGTAR